MRPLTIPRLLLLLGEEVSFVPRIETYRKHTIRRSTNTIKTSHTEQLTATELLKEKREQHH